MHIAYLTHERAVTTKKGRRLGWKAKIAGDLGGTPQSQEGRTNRAVSLFPLVPAGAYLRPTWAHLTPPDLLRGRHACAQSPLTSHSGEFARLKTW
jgi:hypothetical protein